jgi:hypothetical protein
LSSSIPFDRVQPGVRRCSSRPRKAQGSCKPWFDHSFYQHSLFSQQEAVDNAVAAFDDDEARSKVAALAAAKPDEDGWTLVTAKTRKSLEKTGDSYADYWAEIEEEPVDDGTPASKRPRRNKKKADMSNFYRFQRLESHQESKPKPFYHGASVVTPVLLQNLLCCASDSTRTNGAWKCSSHHASLSPTRL